MGYQRREHERVGAKKLGDKVVRHLQELGIEEAGAAVEWLDVEIWGIADHLEQRALAEAKIENLAGVRLKDSGRGLSVRGGFQWKKEGQAMRAEGLIPTGWKLLLFGERFAGSGLNQVREEERVLVPGFGVAPWGALFDRFSVGAGERELVLKDDQILIEGEATPKLAALLREQAVGLVGAEHVKLNFKLFPSEFHYDSRMKEVSRRGDLFKDTVLGLEQTLVSFEQGSSRVTDRGAKAIAHLASLLNGLDEKSRFVIGAYPDESGSGLARRRASVILKHLVEQAGFPRHRIDLVEFQELPAYEDERGKVGVVIL